ncbi:Alpha-mannosidase [Mycobacterium tuberculosis CAS/NITR204]|uniref:Alpha-mannosidase n=1 Tax=Mycobacterium tuberculosis CAS/NITR204 TaxID=1310114 RepID=R4MDU8_MYCTX|nr:Alpha-mannosidase [Mycobacterium tuberculosis CAS/NITR204]
MRAEIRPDFRPHYTFGEVDYLKPYWDTHPQDRADLRRFLADGRTK